MFFPDVRLFTLVFWFVNLTITDKHGTKNLWTKNLWTFIRP